MRLSRRTLAALANALSERFGHSWFSRQFYGLGLEAADTGGNLSNRALALVRALEQPQPLLERGVLQSAPDEREREASLLHLAEEVWPGAGGPAVYGRLAAALGMDGFEYVDGRLIATTPAPLALAPEISALEADLAEMGFATAATHYHQAVDNLTDGNAEACNGQLRSYLEDLFCQVGERLTGRRRADPHAALGDLRDRHLDDGEWNMLRGFWDVCNTRGAHRGLSDVDEALYRAHIATAVGRNLVKKVRAAAL